MLGGAQVDQLIDIVSCSRQAEDRARGQARTDSGDAEAVGLCRRVDVVDRFHAGGAGHVFNENRWIARNVFLQEGNERSCLHIPGASGLSAANNRDRFALVIGCLGKHRARRRPTESKRQYDQGHRFGFEPHRTTPPDISSKEFLLLRRAAFRQATYQRLQQILRGCTPRCHLAIPA